VSVELRPEATMVGEAVKETVGTVIAATDVDTAPTIQTEQTTNINHNLFIYIPNIITR